MALKCGLTMFTSGSVLPHSFEHEICWRFYIHCVIKKTSIMFSSANESLGPAGISNREDCRAFDDSICSLTEYSHSYPNSCDKFDTSTFTHLLKDQRVEARLEY